MDTRLWWVIGGVVLLLIIACASGSSKSPGPSANGLRGLERKTLSSIQVQLPSLLNQDFEGAYAFCNSSKSLWYSKSSPTVYHEVKGIIEGSKWPYAINQDIQAGNNFDVYTVPLRDNGNITREDLCDRLDMSYAVNKPRY